MDTITKKFNERQAIVVKSNVLIPSLSKFSLQQQRFLAYCLSKLDRNKDEIHPVQINLMEFSKTFDIKSHQIYSQIKQSFFEIGKKPLEIIIDAEKEIMELHFWITSIYHNFENKTLIVQLNPNLKEYLLQLRDNFTSYRIKDVYQFQSSHSWMLYELLKQWKNAKKVAYKLDKLKRDMGIQGKYTRFDNMKHKVLLPSIKEINETTDIQVQFDTKRNGRCIDTLIFYIVSNDKTKSPQEKLRKTIENEFDNDINLAPDFAKLLRNQYKVGAKQAKELSNLAHSHDMIDIIEKKLPKIKKRYNNLKEKNTNLGGYVFSTLKTLLTQPSLIESEI